MGELKARLRDDLTAAMKARDAGRTGVLRMAVAAIANAEVAGKQARELTTDEELAVLKKEVASRKDSAQAYRDGNRPELAEKELAEAALLQHYLPEPLTPAELEAIVDEEVARARAGGELSMKSMGPLVKAVTARAQGRAEGGAIAALVRARISAAQ